MVRSNLPIKPLTALALILISVALALNAAVTPESLVAAENVALTLAKFCRSDKETASLDNCVGVAKLKPADCILSACAALIAPAPLT